MKLNHDCVRKLLIYFEENLEIKPNGLPNGIKLKNISQKEELSEFSQEEIFYSADKLVEAKYIIVASKDVAASAMIIKEITWSGHDYLDSIRDHKIWAEVKNRTKGMSSVALEVIKSLAIDATKSMLEIGD